MAAPITNDSETSLNPTSHHQNLEVIEARLREEEEQDMVRTMQLLTLTAEYEEKLKEEEEEEMGKTLEILSNALNEPEIRFLNNVNKGITKFVQFSSNVAIIQLPAEERAEARDARRNKWGSGPMHDELWDGDTGTFREVELTPEELSILLRRRTLVAKIRNFLFTRVVNIDARAHARKMKEEDDEEDLEAAPVATEKRKSSTRLLSLLRRRSTRTTTAAHPDSQRLNEEWVKQMLKQTEKLDDEDELSEKGSSEDIITRNVQ
jgi:hypothetical protein